MPPNVHSLHHGRRRRRSASAESDGGSSSDDTGDGTYDAAAVSPLVGASRGGGKRVVKPVRRDGAWEEVGRAKGKKSKAQATDRFTTETPHLRLALTGPLAPADKPAQTLVAKARTTGSGQKGWTGKGELELELPGEAGEGGRVVVSVTITANITKTKPRPRGESRTAWGGSHVLGTAVSNAASTSAAAAESGTGKRPLATDRNGEDMEGEEEEEEEEEESDDVLLMDAPTPAASNRKGKKRRVSSPPVADDGAKAGEGLTSPTVAAAAEPTGGGLSAREKMLLAAESRLASATARGVQAREGGGKLARKLQEVNRAVDGGRAEEQRLTAPNAWD